jgi:hypothetical protein
MQAAVEFAMAGRQLAPLIPSDDDGQEVSSSRLHANQRVLEFVPTRMLLQRASRPESFIIRLLFFRNVLWLFQLADN